ncbi:MAG: sirohydrochlorin chelatase [Caldilineaceae bacterium]|nr:sirohydrochlorin chelatase [Caldilineaceae bacterium]
MNGVVLIGHGSLHSDSGASMIRLAARLRERGVAPIAEAGFLNFSRPTIAEAVAKCVRAGATSITVQPYFLIDGVYVQQDLPGDISKVAAQFSALTIRVAACFGFHEKLAAIALERVRAVDPQTNGTGAALLVMAHGTPLEAANEPVRQLSAWLHGATGYTWAAPAYLDCNRPRIAEAIDAFAAQGAHKIVSLPYFLHRGRHLRQDLPALLAAARRRHPEITLLEASHLDYDLRLADVITDRLGELPATDRPVLESTG